MELQFSSVVMPTSVSVFNCKPHRVITLNVYSFHACSSNYIWIVRDTYCNIAIPVPRMKHLHAIHLSTPDESHRKKVCEERLTHEVDLHRIVKQWSAHSDDEWTAMENSEWQSIPPRTHEMSICATSDAVQEESTNILLDVVSVNASFPEKITAVHTPPLFHFTSVDGTTLSAVSYYGYLYAINHTSLSNT